MDFLNKFIASFGAKNVVLLGIGFLVFIIVILIYRFIKLKMLRKEIVSLENKMNAVKTLPIQYRLGRVQGISKNMQDIAEKYEEYMKRYEEICDFQVNEIVVLVNEIDEQLFYRRLRGTRRKLADLVKLIDKYEENSKDLLADIEVITEIENIQRVEIIRVKEKYRATNDVFAAVRFKIEEYVPNILESFKLIDEKFIELEDLMNNQRFEEASAFVADIDNDIAVLDVNLRDLPTYISVVRKYIPKRLEDLYETINRMEASGFALDKLNASMRYNKIIQDLENTIESIKRIDLNSVGESIEVMGEEINSLGNDFEKEEIAFTTYKHRKTDCYNHINNLDVGFKEALITLEELQNNYILDKYEITVKEDFDTFDALLQEWNDLSVIIENNGFSYSKMIEELDRLIEKCKPYEIALDKYNVLKDNLRIEEKRGLDELDNINIVLLEIKSEIKNKHLPMINESYKDYIQDSYQKAEDILNFTRHFPIDLERLSTQVDAARDVIYKLYDNVHNLIVTAEMVEDAIVFGNRYRSSFLEVNTELTKAELLFRNGEYTKALTTSVDIIEKISPGSYEMLVNKNKTKV